MDVTWVNPLAPCSTIVHYNIVAIAADGSPKQTVQQVPRSGTFATAPGLNLCTLYRFGVQAVSSDGSKSSVVLPDHLVFESGLPDPVPPVVSIVIQGIASEGSYGSFDPRNLEYCTSPRGTLPPANEPALQTMATRWLNWDSPNDPARAYAGAGNNLIDSLASTGGYVLPFSYTGATVTGAATNPMFTVNPYNKDDVANSTIDGELQRLDTLIIDVRRVWPNTKIIVVGHSNGGLIAEQWWLNRRPNKLQDVTQVFSLDSPLNGVATANACQYWGVEQGCATFGVGQALAQYYSSLWLNQISNDPYWAGEDAQDKVFTAVGTVGDPLYDVGDYRATATFGQKKIGIVSQLYFAPSCAPSGWDLSPQNCPYIGRAVIDDCGPLDDSTGPFFGAPKDLPLHSVVKNCPGVIQAILKYFPSQSAGPGPSSIPTGQITTTTSAPPVPATKLITFQPWVPQAPTGISVPMPGAVLTKTTGKCDGGSPHDSGRHTAFRCTSTDPNVRADPCFANFSSGDPGSSLLCSTDPTTMNLVLLSQAGGQVPVSYANTEDPNAPPWFLILSDGLKCRIALGTDTRDLPYDCGGGTGATVPDRSGPTWTVREGKNLGHHLPTPSSAPVEVTAAYR